jgi:hypothetical protein
MSIRFAKGALFLLALALPCALAAQDDPRGDKLRELHAAFSPKVVVLTWNTRTAAMGQELTTSHSATGVLLNDGVFVVSNQAFAGNELAGMAGMFGGRGGAPVVEDMRVHGAGPEPLSVKRAHEDTGTNLRWFRAEDGKADGVEFGKDAPAPRLGDEVVLIGAHDGTLNHARFFRVARINAVVEEGRYYGLDGSVQDCLGALAVTLDGRVLGMVGQKRSEQDAQGGGIGRIMGGLSDPSRALGNRVLMTPEAFAESMQTARKAALAEDFFEPADRPRTATRRAAFEGTVASATWRDETGDMFVLVDVVSGDVPAEGAVVEILNAASNTIAEFKVTRHYRDPLDPAAPIDQIGGVVLDGDKDLEIERGWRAVVMAVAEPEPEGFRGLTDFRRIDPELFRRMGLQAEGGFAVTRAPTEGTPTAEAGVRVGDVIVRVNDTAIKAEHDLEAFRKLLAEQEGTVKLGVWRRGELLELEVSA